MKKISGYWRDMSRAFMHEFALVLHDPGLILFFLFLPLVYPVLYSLIYNPEIVKEVPIVVVDHDRTPKSREMTRMLDACDELWVKGYASDLDEAKRAMDGKNVFAILEIPSGFQRKIGRTETAPAVLYCDMTLLLRYRGLLVAATDVMQEMGAEILTEKVNLVAPLAETVVGDGDLMPIHNINMGNIRGGFDTFLMPGVIVLILHQCLVLAAGMAGGARLESRRLRGYNPYVVSRSTLAAMIGQALCYMGIMVVPTIFMIHYVPLIFGFPLCGNIFEELAFLLPMVIACCGVGFVFQALVMERESVFVSWVITSVVLLLLSGLIWPRYDMYGFWKVLSAICPSTWGVEGFIKMETNGSSLSQVVTEYRNLWILAAAWWALAWIVQKRVVRPAVWHVRHVEMEKLMAEGNAD